MKRTYGKHRYSRSIVNGIRFWLVMVFLIGSIGPILVSADVVWSDNFDDGNYDGWTICNNTALAAQFPIYGFTESQWSAADNYLKLDQEGWGVITHPSNVASGTWSLDIKINETLAESNSDFGFSFISNDLVLTTDDWDTGLRYSIYFDVFGTAETMELSLRRFSDGQVTIIDTYGTYVPVSGWHRIDITRTEAGLFSVFLNGTHIIQVVDTVIDTSELLWLWFNDGPMIDNIVVSDTVDVICTEPECLLSHPTSPTSTPTTPPPPPLPVELIVIAGGAAVVVIVLAIVFLRRR